MDLIHTSEYDALGLDKSSQRKLALLGDLLRGAGLNVTAVSEPEEIERMHFLDSLSLLSLPMVARAASIVDIGSGGGLPALVLALVLPAQVMALESQRKKCTFIERAAEALCLQNLSVVCGRAEDYGRGVGREAFEVAVSRAVAALPVVAEYSLPLLRKGGWMVAMKGSISDHELIQSERAIAILGGDSLRTVRLRPFPGAENRRAFLACKVFRTQDEYPRRVGIPAKRPLGS